MTNVNLFAVVLSLPPHTDFLQNTPEEISCYFGFELLQAHTEQTLFPPET